MKYIYYQNPLRTKVILTEEEKEIFRLKFIVNSLQDDIGYIKLYLDKDPNEILECPNPAMNGKSNWELAKDLVPDKIYDDEFIDEIRKRANYYLEDLEGYHVGDCTCLPCSCGKCYAESILGIDTIKGLGSHEASKISGLFSPHYNFDERTIDDVLNELANYDPKITPGSWGESKPDLWNSCVPRWKQEAKNAYDWLKNYKEEHGF